ncbi:QueT transporter family protein [Clostridium tertium]|uniref:Queuosine transporter QueT n=1 Tax=Clostridium tertium TaxID=1559 RepID=A0A6N2YKK7_9CLOT
MRNNITKKLVKTAVIAAIYTILTIILIPISYGPIQFRISEILVLLAFIDPFYIIGLTLGCLLANIFGGYGPMDMIFGTLATFLSVTSIYLTGRYIKNRKISIVIASLWPTIFNGLIIGWMLNIVAGLPMVLSMLQVALGEFVVVTLVGIPVYKLIENKYKDRLLLQ